MPKSLPWLSGEGSGFFSKEKRRTLFLRERNKDHLKKKEKKGGNLYLKKGAGAKVCLGLVAEGFYFFFQV